MRSLARQAIACPLELSMFKFSLSVSLSFAQLVAIAHLVVAIVKLLT